MKNEVEIMTYDMLTRYYERNDTSLFFEKMDEHIIWIGPGEGQYVEGKDNMLSAYAKENNTLRFQLSNISIRAVYINKQSYEVLLRFDVDSIYPSGVITHHAQRTSILWRKRPVDGKLAWRYAVMHISNEEEMDARDNIYPIHLDELVKKQAASFYLRAEKQNVERLSAKGIDDAIHFIPYQDIVYIKSGKGKLSVIHTSHDEITVRLLMREIMALLPENFCRVHAGYIINTDELESIRRYSVRLKNGMDIPIPVKRYHAVLADVKACIGKGQGEGR